MFFFILGGACSKILSKLSEFWLGSRKTKIILVLSKKLSQLLSSTKKTTFVADDDIYFDFPRLFNCDCYSWITPAMITTVTKIISDLKSIAAFSLHILFENFNLSCLVSTEIAVRHYYLHFIHYLDFFFSFLYKRFLAENDIP